MSGSWNSQNKVIPGCYINFITNKPLGITLGDRGTVLLLQELSVGSAGEIYTITATESNMPEGSIASDVKLINECLKGSKTVKVYNLEKDHTTVTDALNNLKTVDFEVLCYPYTTLANKSSIATWIKAMRDDEGIKIQAVLENQKADDEGIINVTQGVILADNTELTPAETTAWVAGITAGAFINKSNTNHKYIGAIDVKPRKTKTETELAIKNGEFVMKADKLGNVSSVYDINSLTTFTPDKGKMLSKNRAIRTIDGIGNDITEIFESNYVGKENNNEEGRAKFKGVLVDYLKELERLNAIQNFETNDVTVIAGADSDAILVTCNIQLVDSVEKIYISVNLS